MADEQSTIGALLDETGGSIKTGPFGTKLKASEYTSTGVPVISVGEVGFGRLRIHEKTPRVDDSVWSRMPEFLLNAGDIVFGRKGAVERSAQLQPDEEGYFLGSDGIRIRLNTETCDPKFVAYQLQTAAHRRWMIQHAAGTTMPSLNEGIIRRIPIVLKPIAEQKAIAAVLGALDDKIELNRRMNATLEAMARALFQSWLESNANDPEPRIVEDLIAEGILVIGDGYRAKNSELSDDGLPFVRAGNLKADGLDLAGSEILSAQSVKAARHKVGTEGDVCFTSKGTVGRITRVCSKTGAFVYSPQVCFWRTASPEQLNPHVLYRWMKNGDFMRQVNLVSTQTDMAPYVSLQDQRRMVIELPPPSEQTKFAKQLEPIDARISSNAEESRTLATLRDTLLPKLLSGELSIRNASN